MPYKSDAQRRWMHWAEEHGKIKKGTAHRWDEETKKAGTMNSLPERVTKRKAVKEWLKRRKKKTNR